MKTFNISPCQPALILLLLIMLVGCGKKDATSKEGAPEYINTQWASDTLWDDGLAEVAQYHAERTIYGKVRDFEYTHILVKETFNKEYEVKTDDYSRADLFPVMKINKFARIPTQKYPYHFLTSLFYKREEPAVLHKMTHSSQEWCGNTFKLFQHLSNNYHYLFSSYWDGQGNGRIKLRENIWFEDGLSYTLRALNFTEGLQFEQPVMESQVSNKAGRPAIYEARFAVSQDEVSINGQARQSWQVVVQLDEEKTNTYWFAQEYPNVLLKQESWDGRNLDLKEVKREAYWAAE
jgi:hypothetical protein